MAVQYPVPLEECLHWNQDVFVQANEYRPTLREWTSLPEFLDKVLSSPNGFDTGIIKVIPPDEVKSPTMNFVRQKVDALQELKHATTIKFYNEQVFEEICPGAYSVSNVRHETPMSISAFAEICKKSLRFNPHGFDDVESEQNFWKRLEDPVTRAESSLYAPDMDGSLMINFDHLSNEVRKSFSF
jgi:hypothetical protein